jgi:hypothetical protein
MSTDTSRQTWPSSATINCLKVHKAAARQLPEPTETETLAALKERIGMSDTYRFRYVGAIEKRGRAGEEYETDGHLWSTPPRVWRWIEQNCETNVTPCGCSTGFRNPRWTDDGEYTCTNEGCDETFDRETALEVVNG